MADRKAQSTDAANSAPLIGSKVREDDVKQTMSKSAQKIAQESTSPPKLTTK